MQRKCYNSIVNLQNAKKWGGDLDDAEKLGNRLNLTKFFEKMLDKTRSEREAFKTRNVLYNPIEKQKTRTKKKILHIKIIGGVIYG